MSTAWTAERLSRFRLARTEKIGPLRFAQALARFGSAQAALAYLAETGKISLPPVSQIEKEIEAVLKLNAKTILFGDEAYPPLLAAIPDFPPLLHVKGDLALLKQRQIAIVGARNASSAGLSMAAFLAKELVLKGITVTSGLASGIDGQAHRSALEATRSLGATCPKAGTIAALPGGLDVIYPKTHEKLYAEIAAEGCLISEAPPGSSIHARHFPRRNRLIAGLSLGTVIIEAAEKSGTLITASLCLDYGRVVFAVPGSPADPRSAGGNKLIKEGAFLVETAEDILPHLPKEMSPLRKTKAEHSEKKRVSQLSLDVTEAEKRESGIKTTHSDPETENLPESAKKILCLLSPVPIAIDNLVRQSNLPAQEVLSSLSFLNMLERVSFHETDMVALSPKK